MPKLYLIQAWLLGRFIDEMPKLWQVFKFEMLLTTASVLRRLLTEENRQVLDGRQEGLEAVQVGLLYKLLLVPAPPVLDQPLQNVPGVGSVACKDVQLYISNSQSDF